MTLQLTNDVKWRKIPFGINKVHRDDKLLSISLEGHFCYRMEFSISLEITPSQTLLTAPVIVPKNWLSKLILITPPGI